MMSEVPPPTLLPPPAPRVFYFTVLQLSSFVFLLPALLAAQKEDLWGTFILLFNVCVSAFVHRASAAQHEPIAATVDGAAVFLWIVYNAVLLLHTREQVRVVGSLMLLVYVGLVAFIRKQWPWRSHVRTYLHASMHCSGAAGTALLLM